MSTPGSCLCPLSSLRSPMAVRRTSPTTPDTPGLEPECDHRGEQFETVCKQLLVLLNRGYKVWVDKLF